MKKVIEKIRKFNTDRDWDQFHTPENLAKSISIEAGELLECFQWNSKVNDKEHICEELADVVCYSIMMADALNVDLEEICLSKIKKNEVKYPVNKAKGKSDKYDKL